MINETEGEFKFPKVICVESQISTSFDCIRLIVLIVFLFDNNKNISFVNVQFKNNFFALSAGFGQTLPSFLSINKLSQ